jgi:CBS domain-containing protein
MTVGDLALAVPVCVDSAILIRDAELELIRQGTGELYLVDEQQRLLGVISETDFLGYRLLGGDGETGVASLAAPAKLTLSPMASLQSAARMLCEFSMARLPVIDHGRLIGVLHRTTLLRMISEGGISLSELAEVKIPADRFSPAAIRLPSSSEIPGLGWHRESA